MSFNRIHMNPPGGVNVLSNASNAYHRYVHTFVIQCGNPGVFSDSDETVVLLKSRDSTSAPD
eukprot:SAG22_NODE_59_length_23617_cov_252.868144_14_plen_62_part_00